MSERVINNVIVDGINYLSKEQFYKMCKISKQTAKQLKLSHTFRPSLLCWVLQNSTGGRGGFS